MRLACGLALVAAACDPPRVAPACPVAPPGTVSVGALLPELADLAHLTRLPSPRYASGLASSYDRRATTPDDPATWFANHDYNQFVRDETHDGRTEHVMLDVDGPGAVVRMWSAGAAGTLRVYLDGAAEPELAAPMAAALGGRVEPFAAPLAHTSALGSNLYFPIPYRGHVKVTTDAAVDEQRKLYCQLDYRTYAPGTPVETFSRAAAARARACIDDTATTLVVGPVAPAAPPRAFHLGPGQPFALDMAEGGAVVRLELRPAARDPSALRATVLAIAFDGHETVRVPLGDFFASGPGWNRVRSLPFAITDGALIARFPMPFRTSMQIALEGGGSADGALVVEPYAFGDESLYFHARWHAPESIPSGARVDWPLVAIEGRGLYVGTALEVDNPGGGPWWGEGDEKIYVDGESLPSHRGTGTEDYFGYAWSSTELFDHAYHNQTRADARDGGGHTAVDRFHVLDPIPFSRALRFDLEVLNWTGHPLEYAAVAYYYAR